MNKYITLPILFHVEATSQAVDCGCNWKLSDCKVKEVTFFNLDAITAVFEDGEEYSHILSGGMSYYSTMSQYHILDMIDREFSSEFIFYDN